MEKRDFKKELQELYGPSAREVIEVDVPAMNFLKIDGMGDPNTSQDYSSAVEALFTLSYGLKFAVKKGSLAVDYGVMPLEGLWWADDLAAFRRGDRSNWKWTLMIMQPDAVDADLVATVRAEVARKKGPPALGAARFESFTEGLCAQILHVGPFSEEAPTIERVHAFIQNSGRSPVGKHHEIYLTDIRRADPAKWKTVIRQPME